MCALVQMHGLGMHAIEHRMICQVRQANSLSFCQSDFNFMSKVSATPCDASSRESHQQQSIA